MKVLFVGVFCEYSTNHSQLRALQRAGCDVVPYDYRLSPGRPGIADAARASRFDLILLSKCEGVPGSTVDQCNAVGKTCLWWQDWAGNIHPDFLDKAKRCNAVACSRTVPFHASSRVNSNTHLVVEGFDADCDQPVDGVHKLYDVTFIGGMHRQRVDYHRDVGFTILSRYGADHALAVAESRINLNFTEPDDGTSDRPYKIMSAGGFLLTTPWPELPDQFVVGRDLETFQTPGDLHEKIVYFLDHPEEREKIAAAGQAAVQPFSRDAWASRILEISA